MIKDYKSRNEFLKPASRRSPWRARLFALLGVSICASAIYATLGMSASPNPVDTAETESAPVVVAETPVTETPAAEPLTRVSLQLPGQSPDRQTTPETQPTNSVNAVREAAVVDDKANSPSEQSAAPEQPSTEGVATEVATAPVTPEVTPADTDNSNTIPSADGSEEIAAIDRGTWHEEEVKSGDSLARIFSRLNLSANLLHRIVNSSKEAKTLANIRPGETIKVRLDKQGNLLELVHKQSAIRSLQILPSDESFTAQINDRSLEKRVATASGTITSSLYMSAQRAGLSDSLTMELANIFGWDIDFALEIRAGDQFSLIYEEEYLDGKKYRNGPILAAEFINQGKVFRAIRFEDDEGYSSYYSPKGESMRKAFLRAPVDFRRISSRFTKARYHPVLGKKRPHRGVDYAAAIGTPIKAAGDGRVIFRGVKGGYGRTVIIRHGSKYTTLYAHMSKFRGSVKNGTRVRQGQVIGYVGKSGLATGPHLHYEFRVNGVHRNPLTVKLPAAEPLPKAHREKFNRISKPLLEELDLISKTIVADAG